jgi:hypothetical protein
VAAPAPPPVGPGGRRPARVGSSRAGTAIGTAGRPLRWQFQDLDPAGGRLAAGGSQAFPGPRGVGEELVRPAFGEDNGAHATRCVPGRRSNDKSRSHE